jgi:hypothetical protein
MKCFYLFTSFHIRATNVLPKTLKSSLFYLTYNLGYLLFFFAPLLKMNVIA